MDKSKALPQGLFSESLAKKSRNQLLDCGFLNLAEWTGLEPATPGVTGRYSNQLNYHSWQEALLHIV